MPKENDPASSRSTPGTPVSKPVRKISPTPTMTAVMMTLRTPSAVMRPRTMAERGAGVSRSLSK